MAETTLADEEEINNLYKRNYHEKGNHIVSACGYTLTVSAQKTVSPAIPQDEQGVANIEQWLYDIRLLQLESGQAGILGRR